LIRREIGRVVRDWDEDNSNEQHGMDDEEILVFERNNWLRAKLIRLSIAFNMDISWSLGPI
jgi:hypothetical protein